MKLFQMVFTVIIYVHLQACVWFLIVQIDSEWIPPFDYIEPDADIYSSSSMNRYWNAVYHSALILTGNEILPIGTFQIAFVSLAIFMGAIVNANIFGQMAVILADLNAKSVEF
jgi:hypothetical protein